VGTAASGRPAEQSSVFLELAGSLGQPLAQLLKRPEVTIEHVVPILRELVPEVFRQEENLVSHTPPFSKSVVSANDQRPFLACPELAEGTNDALALPNDQRPTAHDGVLPSALRNELKSVETEIKYEGYLHQQQRAIERLKKAEQRNIPDWFDYRSVSGLSREMQEKLLKIRPRTLGHASRIPGVTPAAVSLVNVYIEIQTKRRQQVAAV